ncbi:MAG: DUF4388 domain-containing protein [Planctomycetota bacterium]|nr:DUF4388 domain-containing protein [Planctomycetota bacterium]
MSFQGDVAGIGLGELLQGLARGNRDGVLTLLGDRISGAIGLKGGMLYLLPGPDENDDLWRDRSLRAWVADPKPLMETQRREMIARAERLETFFQMLETSNLHFRFEQGELPLPHGATRKVAKKVAKKPEAIPLHDERPPQQQENPWGTGMPVEYMLLEHARLTDENTGANKLQIEFYDLPRALDPSRFATNVRDFLEQCDGASSLQEIADRLGWPLRQARGHVLEHYTSGAVRLAQPRELLAAAHKELDLGHVGRAMVRITGWIRSSPPGPPPAGDAELLLGEWDSGRLKQLLPVLKARDGRALMRKLDHLHDDVQAAVERWQALHEAHRGDEATLLHTIALRLATTESPDARSFTELLRLAHSLQERGHSGRTRTLLRMVANRIPARPQTRIELGRRMLDTGLIEEGSRWLLNAARDLIDEGEGEGAIGPIRAVLARVPEHTEGHGLMIEARAVIARQRRRRWKSLVAISLVVVIALVGLVRMRGHHELDQQIYEIEKNLNRPEIALELLNRHFPNDDSERVAELRATVLAVKKNTEDALRAAWMEEYDTILEEVELGDPARGFERAVELAPPPFGNPRSWPDTKELLDALTLRLTRSCRELDLPVDASLQELHEEERLQSLLFQIRDLAEGHVDDAVVTSFAFRVSSMYDTISDRRDQRALERQEAVRLQNEQQQDVLLGAARAHAAAGDLVRAVETYDLLEATDGFNELRPLLAREMGDVRDHWNAVQAAVALAEEGRHEEALDTLGESPCRDPGEHLLPWDVISWPTEARARFSGGSSRVTPFTAQSADGELIKITFEAEGFEPREVVVKSPRDLEVFLNFLPERRYASAHRVDAVPIPSGDDHVIADRKGRVIRLDKDSRPRWSVELNTLGGIARTPVFLPRLPGHLLVLSEDGLAWLIDAGDGTFEGPIDARSPLEEGPVLTSRGAWARFSDGRYALWEDRLTPTYHSPESSFVEFEEGDPKEEWVPETMVVLRPGPDSGLKLESPWTGWTVEVRDGEFFALNPEGEGFTGRRRDKWTFVAWEKPKALIPDGRLWVSDGDGLRSYVPEKERLMRFDQDRTASADQD